MTLGLTLMLASGPSTMAGSPDGDTSRRSTLLRNCTPLAASSAMRPQPGVGNAKGFGQAPRAANGTPNAPGTTVAVGSGGGPGDRGAPWRKRQPPPWAGHVCARMGRRPPTSGVPRRRGRRPAREESSLPTSGSPQRGARRRGRRSARARGGRREVRIELRHAGRTAMAASALASEALPEHAGRESVAERRIHALPSLLGLPISGASRSSSRCWTWSAPSLPPGRLVEARPRAARPRRPRRRPLAGQLRLPSTRTCPPPPGSSRSTLRSAPASSGRRTPGWRRRPWAGTPRDRQSGASTSATPVAGVWGPPRRERVRERRDQSFSRADRLFPMPDLNPKRRGWGPRLFPDPKRRAWGPRLFPMPDLTRSVVRGARGSSLCRT